MLHGNRLYAGTNVTGFYTADALASLVSDLPFLIWAVSASIAMIFVKWEVVAPTLRESGLREAGCQPQPDLEG